MDDKQIAREAALQCASLLYLGKGTPAEFILRQARMFEAYISGTETPAKVQDTPQ